MKFDLPVLSLAGCYTTCRYTEVINLRFPHCGIASLAQVSTMGLCPCSEININCKIKNPEASGRFMENTNMRES